MRTDLLRVRLARHSGAMCTAQQGAAATGESDKEVKKKVNVAA